MARRLGDPEVVRERDSPRSSWGEDKHLVQSSPVENCTTCLAQGSRHPCRQAVQAGKGTKHVDDLRWSPQDGR